MRIKIEVVAKEEIKRDEVGEEKEEKDVIIVEEVEIEIDMVILEEIEIGVEAEVIVIIEIAENVIAMIEIVSVTEIVIVMTGIVKEIEKEIETEMVIDMIGKTEIETVEKKEINQKIDQAEIVTVAIHLKNIQDLNHMKKTLEDVKEIIEAVKIKKV